MKADLAPGHSAYHSGSLRAAVRVSVLSQNTSSRQASIFDKNLELNFLYVNPDWFRVTQRGQSQATHSRRIQSLKALCHKSQNQQSPSLRSWSISPGLSPCPLTPLLAHCPLPTPSLGKPPWMNSLVVGAPCLYTNKIPCFNFEDFFFFFFFAYSFSPLRAGITTHHLGA